MSPLAPLPRSVSSKTHSSLSFQSLFFNIFSIFLSIISSHSTPSSLSFCLSLYHSFSLSQVLSDTLKHTHFWRDMNHRAPAVPRVLWKNPKCQRCILYHLSEVQYILCWADTEPIWQVIGLCECGPQPLCVSGRCFSDSTDQVLIYWHIFFYSMWVSVNTQSEMSCLSDFTL